MTSRKKDFQIIIKIVVIFFFSILFLSCENDKEELRNNDSVFEVVIKTDTDSLSMYPSMVSEKFLDTSYTSLFKGYLKNGEINFKGKKLPHPFMFDFFEEKHGLSDKFFLDNGRTEVSVSFKTEIGKIKINDKFKSKSQTEYEELKTLGLNEVDSLIKKSITEEERTFLRSKRDSIIVNYIYKNPKSYVPLWLMVNYVPHGNKIYNKLYDESLHLFSDAIKKTELFKRLKRFIDDTKENPISYKLMMLKLRSRNC